MRILAGRNQDAADYIELCNLRKDFAARVAQRIRKSTHPDAHDAVTAPALSIHG